MSRRILLASALAGTLAVGAAVAPAASAGNVAWSVSIGAPGVAVSAGSPYWGPAYPYYPSYRPVYVPPPVVYPAPVYAPYRPVIVAPRPYYKPYYKPYRPYYRPYYGPRPYRY